jgi:predicted DNA helicase
MQQEFSNIVSYISYFKTLVEFEREEDKKLHELEIQRFSPQKRERVGRAVLDLKGKSVGRGLGKTFLVKFSSDKDISENQIQVGDLVIVTSSKKPSGREQQGSVVSKSKFTMTIGYSQRPAPYHFTENLRLDLFTNDVVFQRQLKALSRVKGNWNLKRNLLGNTLIEYGTKKIKSFDFENKVLNSKQQESVKHIVNTEDFFLLHGPPGTGKTTTLVESIIQLQTLGKRVLVCCDSNQGIDNILEKLSKYSDSVVRIGNPSRVDTTLTEFTLDSMLEQNDFYKEAQGLYSQIEIYFTQQKQYQKPTRDLTRGLSDAQIIKYSRERRSSRGVPATIMKKMGSWLELQFMIRELQEKIKRFERFATEEILNSKQIICATNSFSGGDLLEEYVSLTKKNFDVVVIDEATQAVEPSCLVPALFAPKLILAGDHKQLPPTVLSENARALEYSLFERLIHIYHADRSLMLDTQYRMNTKIMKFSNKYYYHNELLSGIKNKDWILDEDFFGESPIVFIDSNSKDNKEMQKEHSHSYYNSHECTIAKHIVEIYSKVYSPSSLGIITPYDAQVKELKKVISSEIKVSSIDGFQGGEREIIIISFVRSNLKESIGFLKDSRRLNVALTRARKKLILIGDSKTLSSSEEYTELLKLCTQVEIHL